MEWKPHEVDTWLHSVGNPSTLMVVDWPFIANVPGGLIIAADLGTNGGAVALNVDGTDMGGGGGGGCRWG